jgi:hypothetical protein
MLLSLIAAMNASQGMVLCVGRDGRVAIEPVGHDHCADGTHLCESDAATHDKYLAPNADREGCPGCTDISMADEIGSDPAAAASKGISAAIFAASSSLLIPPNGAAAQTDFRFQISDLYPPHSLLLSSIVLQV